MMPVIDRRELLLLVGISLPIGVLLSLLYEFFALIRAVLPKGKGKLSRFLSEKVPTFFFDIIFFLTVSAINVLLFSGYGGGSVRLIALLSEALSFFTAQKLEIAAAKKIGGLAAEIINKIKNKIKNKLKDKGKNSSNEGTE